MFQTDQSRWAALQTRNPLASTSFVYCVLTTRIVCRPTCKARLARCSNVIFHDSYEEAVKAGFRACKRCRPDYVAPDGGSEWEPQREAVERACRVIEEGAGVAGGEGGGKSVGLEELAKSAGLTKSHFHRVFKKVKGVTPRIYAVNLRAEKLLDVVAPGLSESPATSVGCSEGALTPITPGVDGDQSAVGKFIAAADFEAAEGLEAGSWQSCDDVDLQSGIFESEKSSSVKNIEYTIQLWASGFVLIAATKDGICWLEAGNTVSELSLSLAHEFPLAELEMSDWTTNVEYEMRKDGKHVMFATVMEALVNPTGKVVDIPFDVS